jgi:hypothetical protein
LTNQTKHSLNTKEKKNNIEFEDDNSKPKK